MWLRNLLFIGLVVAAIAALRANLFPLSGNAQVRPVAPVTRGSELDEVIGRVNAAFRAEWTAQSLQHAPLADEYTIIRRLSLALTGTIPSWEEMRQLEAIPPENRVDSWLSYLLHDRRFGNYFAERLARAYVGTEDGPFIIYRRRRFVTWLSEQLLTNRPYGSLVAELIVSDGLWTDKPATNFITVTTVPEGDGPDQERLAGRVARAFLGVRLDCAQCHNHPFEEWQQKDFHGLAAFFGKTQQGLTGLYEGKGEHMMTDHKTAKKETIEPAVPFLKELLPTDGSRRSRLARWVTHPQNEYFARATVQRVWALLFGRPYLDSVESMDALSNPPQPLVLLAQDFAAHHHDLQRLIRIITASEVFWQDSKANHELTDEHERHWAAFPLVRLRPEQVVGSVQQAAALKTINAESNLLVRATYQGSINEFVKRYGDTGEDEFTGRGGTIPQRLLLLNGDMVKESTENKPFNASTLIANLSANDRAAVETAYLSVLTRRPTAEEAAHFESRLAGSKGQERISRLEDLFWTLINSTEFSWNH
ncbi:MAG: DUF1549 domain-containing protein [Planctomycetia bacterium]|nr:DUF1549 domain-containing protein [Planctomycetia bacterium]